MTSRSITGEVVKEEVNQRRDGSHVEPQLFVKYQGQFLDFDDKIASTCATHPGIVFGDRRNTVGIIELNPSSGGDGRRA